MQLLLVRHAHALDLGDSGAQSDAERPLSERGRHQADGLARFLESRQFRADAVFSSPLIRARQTAEHLLRVSTSSALNLSDYLAPGELRPKKLSRVVEELTRDVAILVGHMPEISEYAGWLLAIDPTVIPFAKGAAALICFPEEIDPGSGSLELLISPKYYLVGGESEPE
jgi:phosphohistidine phosphatase